MEENHLPLPIEELPKENTPSAAQSEEKEQTTLGERFSGFAAYHFGLSLSLGGVVCTGLITILIPIIATVAETGAGRLLLILSMMLIYAPLGAVAAAFRKWTVPSTRREKILAVLQPAAVAWLWVGVVELVIALGGTAAASLVLIVFMLSIWFAAPSSIVVISCADLWAFGSDLENMLGLAVVGMIAGFLPPLLFALGSFWEASRREKKNAKRTAEA